MKDFMVQQYLDILKSDEIRKIFKPVLDMVFYEMSYYIYITLSLIFLIFMMNLTTLVVLFMNWRIHPHHVNDL